MKGSQITSQRVPPCQLLLIDTRITPRGYGLAGGSESMPKSRNEAAIFFIISEAFAATGEEFIAQQEIRSEAARV